MAERNCRWIGLRGGAVAFHLPGNSENLCFVPIIPLEAKISSNTKSVLMTPNLCNREQGNCLGVFITQLGLSLSKPYPLPERLLELKARLGIRLKSNLVKLWLRGNKVVVKIKRQFH